MNAPNNQQSRDSSIWITTLTNGVTGITMKVKHALHYDASPIQTIEVFDSYGFGRVLMLGGTVIFTDKDAHIYHEMIVHPALMMHKTPSSVCVIGGGDGGCLSELLKYQAVKKVTAVEIDAAVTKAVKAHFPEFARGFSDKRVQLVFDEGFNFLSKTQETFDVILVDSYDPGGPVQSLETAEFHSFVSKRLSDTGIAVFQTDSPTIRSDYLRSTILSISSLFANYMVYTCAQPSFPDGICSFVVCSKQKGGLDAFDKERYASIAPTCRYYNADTHRGAFLLPEHIRRIVV